MTPRPCMRNETMVIAQVLKFPDLSGLCDDDLSCVACCAEDPADLGHGLHSVEAVDGEALAQHDEERVAAAHLQRLSVI